MLPSEAKNLSLAEVAEADALVDEMVAPYLAETRPMRLRREREEQRGAFMERVHARADAAGAARPPASRPGPSQEIAPPAVPAGPAAAVVPAPKVMFELVDDEFDPQIADAHTLQAAIALGLAQADDEEAQSEP